LVCAASLLLLAILANRLTRLRVLLSQAEHRAMVQANKYQSIFQNAGEGIFLSTPEGALIEANPAVILPFLRGLKSRGYAAIVSFCIGVMPPMPMLGRS
jgi:hypothetical protein